MASLFRRKKRNGSYYEEWHTAIFLLDGRRLTRSLKTSNKREAQKRASIIEADILERRFKEKLKGENMTVTQLLDMYIDHHSKQYKESWKRDISCKRKLCERLGNLKLVDVTPIHLAKYVKARRDKDKVTNTTIYHDLKMMRHAYNKALQEWSLIRETPFLMFKLPKQNPPRERVLSKKEVRKIMKELPDAMKPVMTMALNTGLRLSNIILMEWQWVDLVNRIITIPAKSHKNRKIHRVAMNNTVFSLLQGIRKNCGKILNPDNPGYVFLHELDQPYTKSSAGRAFRRACERAKVEVRFHDLRHTFATIAGSRGASAFDLRDVLGHSDVRTTSKYTHQVFERMREVANLVEGQV